MSYIKPDSVVAPKSKISDLQIIYDGGEGKWSLAKMKWAGDEVITLRWNGTSKSPLGNPQSRGIPTWFVLPDEIGKPIENMLKLNNGELLSNDNRYSKFDSVR